MHVRYLSDGRFNTLQTHTQCYIAQNKLVALWAHQSSRENALLDVPASDLLFTGCVLPEKTILQTPKSPCLTEVTWKPFPLLSSRTDLFYPCMLCGKMRC